MQSNLVPTLLVVAGVFGSFKCLDRAVDLFLRGDLAGKEPVIAFACFCVLGVIGLQEMRSAELHESGESGGF